MICKLMLIRFIVIIHTKSPLCNMYTLAPLICAGTTDTTRNRVFTADNIALAFHMPFV